MRLLSFLGHFLNLSFASASLIVKAPDSFGEPPNFGNIEKRALPLNLIGTPPDASIDATQVLTDAVSGCNDLLSSAINAINAAPPDLANVQYIFGDSAVSGVVASDLSPLALFCSLQTSQVLDTYLSQAAYFQEKGTITTTTTQACDAGSIPAYTSGTDLILCSSFYSLPRTPSQCWGTSTGGMILREIMFQPNLANTGPGYYQDNAVGAGVLNLDEGTRLTTPDAYQYLAVQDYLHCTGGNLP